MLQAPVKRLGGAVGGTGAVDVGQDVLAAADQDLCQCLDLLQPVRDGPLQRADEPSHQVLSRPESSAMYAWIRRW